MRSSQDSNLGLLNSSEMILPTEPLAGIGAEERWCITVRTLGDL